MVDPRLIEEHTARLERSGDEKVAENLATGRYPPHPGWESKLAEAYLERTRLAQAANRLTKDAVRVADAANRKAKGALGVALVALIGSALALLKVFGVL